MTKMTNEAYDALRTAGGACARLAAERWGVGFTRLDGEQKKAEVCRQVCALFFENHGHTQTAVCHATPGLRALLDAGLSHDAQALVYASALAAREATWGLS